MLTRLKEEGLGPHPQFLGTKPILPISVHWIKDDTILVPLQNGQIHHSLYFLCVCVWGGRVKPITEVPIMCPEHRGLSCNVKMDKGNLSTLKHLARTSVTALQLNSGLCG